MGKPVKQIREMENGDVVFKFMPRGRLEAPEGVVAKAVAQDGFTLAWTEVEHAACYRAEIYGMDGDSWWPWPTLCAARRARWNCRNRHAKHTPAAFSRCTMPTKIPQVRPFAGWT